MYNRGKRKQIPSFAHASYTCVYVIRDHACVRSYATLLCTPPTSSRACIHPCLPHVFSCQRSAHFRSSCMQDKKTHKRKLVVCRTCITQVHAHIYIREEYNFHTHTKPRSQANKNQLAHTVALVVRLYIYACVVCMLLALYSQSRGRGGNVLLGWGGSAPCERIKA